MNNKPPSFPYDHLAIIGVKNIKKYIPPKNNSEVNMSNELSNFTPEDLSPLVEKIAEKLAEDVNKAGINEQIKFLESNGWDKSMIVKYLTEDDGASNEGDL